MSNDLISRQEVIQAIGNERVWVDENIQNPQHHYHMMNEATRILSIIGNLPSVQPKTGWWKHVEIESNKSDTGYFMLPLCECSVCDIYVEQESNYCPHCGAKMEGEAK